MKKIISLLLTGLLATGILAGCGNASAPSADSSGNANNQAGSSAETEEPAKTAGEDLQDFNIILDWYPNAIHSFLYVAQEKGYFAEEGLNVTLTAPAGYSDGLTFPAAGKAQAGLYYMNDAAIGYADEDMDVEVIGAVTQETLSCMIALKDKQVTSPADFAGKKIGYSGGEALKQKLLTTAKQAGLSEDDFELIDVGFDIETAVTTGTVDAVAGGMINNEVVELRNAGYEIDYWSLEDYGVPREYDILIVVNKSSYEADPALYEGFLNACKKGFEDVKNDPEAGLDVLFAHEDAENYALDRTMETESLDILLNIEKESGVPFLSMSKDVWNTDIAWMLENGLLENSVDAGEFTTAE